MSGARGIVSELVNVGLLAASMSGLLSYEGLSGPCLAAQEMQ